MDLGRIGVWTTYRQIGEENAGEAARLVQDLGFGTFWLGGSPRLASVRPLLEATDSLVVATGIVNVWSYDPAELAAEYVQLAEEFPDRVLVGIGIGHPEATSHYATPMAAMRGFLDGLDQADTPLPRDRRCLAALGPKMLELCKTRSRGSHTYFVPVAHTRAARGAAGRGRAACSGARVRGRRRRRQRQGKGAPVRRAVSGPAQLHEQPASPRVQSRTTSPTAALTG